MDGYPRREPRAFQGGNPNDFAAQRIMYIAICLILLVLIGKQLHIVDRFVDGNFSQKNSLRFCGLTGSIALGAAVFLLAKTSREGDLAENMIREWPVAAYTMSACVLMMALASFHFFTDLLGALGIVYFLAAWGLVLNVILALPFLTRS